MNEETNPLPEGDYRNEGEAPVSATPGNDTPLTTEAMAGLEAVKVDPLADKATQQAAHERAMFERYVTEQGQKIPDNFKSAADWFDSLKGAQAQFTQSQQEVADLKRQYQMAGNTDNPDHVEAPVAPEVPAAAPAEPTPASTEELMDELRIPEPAAAEPAPEEAPSQEYVRPTEADYTRWTAEVNSTGQLTAETREEIKNKTGFNDGMVNDFLTAQQAKRKEAFGKAADIVGGGQKLSQVLRWASTAYSGEQLSALQSGLAGASSELTLRGLTAAFDAAHPNGAAEPKATRAPGAVNPATAQASRQLPGYKSMQEYRMDMSNPRFKRDDSFRKAVEERASKTDWRTMG